MLCSPCGWCQQVCCHLALGSLHICDALGTKKSMGLEHEAASTWSGPCGNPSGENRGDGYSVCPIKSLLWGSRVPLEAGRVGGWGWSVTQSTPEPHWGMAAKPNLWGHPAQQLEPPMCAHLDLSGIGSAPRQCQPRAWHPPGAWGTPVTKQLPLLCWHCVPGRGQRVTATCGGTAHGAKDSSACPGGPDFAAGQ